MFYGIDILQKRKGKFGIVWVAATRSVSLTKRDYCSVNVQRTCDDIVECITYSKQKKEKKKTVRRFSLYLSSQLMLGVVRVYEKQLAYFLTDCTNLFKGIAKAPPLGATLNLKETLYGPTTLDIALQADVDGLHFNPLYGYLGSMDNESMMVNIGQFAAVESVLQPAASQRSTSKRKRPIEDEPEPKRHTAPHREITIEEIPLDNMGAKELEVIPGTDLPAIDIQGLQSFLSTDLFSQSKTIEQDPSKGGDVQDATNTGVDQSTGHHRSSAADASISANIDASANLPGPAGDAIDKDAQLNQIMLEQEMFQPPPQVDPKEVELGAGNAGAVVKEGVQPGEEEQPQAKIRKTKKKTLELPPLKPIPAKNTGADQRRKRPQKKIPGVDEVITISKLTIRNNLETSRDTLTNGRKLGLEIKDGSSVSQLFSMPGFGTHKQTVLGKMYTKISEGRVPKSSEFSESSTSEKSSSGTSKKQTGGELQPLSKSMEVEQALHDITNEQPSREHMRDASDLSMEQQSFPKLSTPHSSFIRNRSIDLSDRELSRTNITGGDLNLTSGQLRPVEEVQEPMFEKSSLNQPSLEKGLPIIEEGVLLPPPQADFPPPQQQDFQIPEQLMEVPPPPPQANIQEHPLSLEGSQPPRTPGPVRNSISVKDFMRSLESAKSDSSRSTISFKTMYPCETTSRPMAAQAFATLLVCCKQRRVSVEQDEPYSNIRITRRKKRS